LLAGLAEKIERLVFPAVCRHCGDPFREGLSNVLCGSCYASILPDADPRCRLCGTPLPPAAFDGASLLRCRECADRTSPLEEVRCFAAYDGALRLAHHFFKFEGMSSLGPVLGRSMASIVPAEWIRWRFVLVPVPLSPDRMRERGYNPAQILAREVSLAIRIPLRETLVKIGPRKPQMELGRSERRRSPRGAFHLGAGESVPPRAVLVDDVTTTGATLEECARVLREAGCEEVRALLLGRTPAWQ